MPPCNEIYILKRQLDELQSQSVSTTVIMSAADC